MSFKLMNEINDNYHTATSVHREIADSFWFIYLPGYALWHEYQHFDESLTQRKIKRYIGETYHMIMPDKIPKDANVIEPLLTNKNRKSLKMDDTYNIIQELFSVYQKWEESTLNLYQQIATEIFASGEISTFNFIGEIIKDVKAELVFLNDKIIELKAMDWDMPQIIGEQADYLERYERLMRELLGKSKMYHHHNSALDSHSRTSVLDKYPD